MGLARRFTSGVAALLLPAVQPMMVGAVINRSSLLNGLNSL